MKERRQLRDELVQQHERLADVLQQLVDATDSADARDAQRLWTTFEAQLSEHLACEEDILFPLVEPFHAEEVQALRQEHERIRGMVSEFGIRCDLHTLHRRTLLGLVETLREHAEREDRTLYQWVEHHAPLDTRRHLLGLLARTVRADLTPQG